MPADIEIQDTRTGEVRVHREDSEWDLGGYEYQWGCGNYSCDCNRSIFFDRAGDNSMEGEIVSGETRYAVLGVTPAGGPRIAGDPRAPQ